MLVWQRRDQAQAKVYAFAGWGEAAAVAEARRASLGRRRYRHRFGIETSYRQKNQARGPTTSRSVAYRLLLEGVAYLPRQVWACLSEGLARAAGLKPSAWRAWRLVDLLESPADGLKSAWASTHASPATPIPYNKNCPLESTVPLPARIGVFGTPSALHFSTANSRLFPHSLAAR